MAAAARRGRGLIAVVAAVWLGTAGAQPMPPVKPRPPAAAEPAPIPAPAQPSVQAAPTDSGRESAPQLEPPPTPPGIGPVTKLPLPRYVSLRSNRIHARRGPGLDYRKDWVFRRAGLPVRVIEEYGDWRRIVDSDDAGGWVYHSLLAGRRTALITAPTATLHRDPDAATPAVAQAEQGVVAALRDCRPGWCLVDIDGHRGWIARAQIWGVDPDEVWPD